MLTTEPVHVASIHTLGYVPDQQSEAPEPGNLA